MNPQLAGVALAIGSLILAVSGIGVLAYALHQHQHQLPSTNSVARRHGPPLTTALPRPPSATPTTSNHGAGDAGSDTHPATVPAQHERTVLDDGPAGDQAIQEVLEASSPRNLPTAIELQLTILGRQVLLAEVTGEGRSTWLGYFRSTGTPWLYTHVRVQAAIARASSPGHADVHLVWTGTDLTGLERDDQPAIIHFQQHNGVWQPVR
ncbi:hypothetical protein ABZ832_28745 [Streptantibioticus parmotrematis]|uniref:hypothetical protein n=1 Tax=Streptantibioticus parmotrematis TaxID=2873249 RepID=UPI0033C4B9DC